MKILAICETPNGGEQLATQSLIRFLRKQKVSVVHRELPALSRTQLFFYFYWLFASTWSAFFLALKYRKHTVFYTTTFTALLGGLLAQPFTHQFVCFHYHGNRIPASPSPRDSKWHQFTQWIKYVSTKKLHAFAWSKVDLFCAPSQSQLDTLGRQFPSLGKKQLILPNGVDHGLFRPVSPSKKKQLRKQYTLEEQGFICLLIGRVDPKKGWVESLKIIQELKKEVGEKLVVVCVFPKHGNDQKYFQNFQSRLQSSEVSFKTFVQPRHVAHFYQLSDCVLSSSTEEVFPLTLLEASACATPYFSIRNETVEHYLELIDKDLTLPNAPLKAATQMVCCLRKKSLEKKLVLFARQYSWMKTATLLRKSLAL